MVQRDPDKAAQLQHPRQARLPRPFHLSIELSGA
jgi:hypothetical protein